MRARARARVLRVCLLTLIFQDMPIMNTNNGILDLLRTYFLPIRRSFKGREVVDAAAACVVCVYYRDHHKLVESVQIGFLHLSWPFQMIIQIALIASGTFFYFLPDEFQQVCNRIFCALIFCVFTLMQGEQSYVYRAIVHLFQGEAHPQLPGCR